MRDLPSKGRCHAAFLLAYSARVRSCCDLNEWVIAAAAKPTQQAASFDLLGMAGLLLDSGLVRLNQCIVSGRELSKFDRVADAITFKGIARLLLYIRPPDWLRSVVIDGKLVKEFIPKLDLDALSWLGADLEPIILAVHGRLYGSEDDGLRKALGDAGELVIVSALRAKGENPRHVALISDRFGYDIELGSAARLHGVEVKAAVQSTANRLFLSRNEFEVAKRMGNRWKVTQVVFSSKVVATGVATDEDVETIRELPVDALNNLAPKESIGFRWTEGAEFRPQHDMWCASALVPPAGFRIEFV